LTSEQLDLPSAYWPVGSLEGYRGSSNPPDIGDALTADSMLIPRPEVIVVALPIPLSCELASDMLVDFEMLTSWVFLFWFDLIR
jgi:hypothetical protein